MARQREPVEKRVVLLELVDMVELELVDKQVVLLELVDKKELELVSKRVVLLVDKKELELVSKSIWKTRTKDTNILLRSQRGHWWQHNMGVRG